jgi:hypothetical protein
MNIFRILLSLFSFLQSRPEVVKAETSLIKRVLRATGRGFGAFFRALFFSRKKKHKKTVVKKKVKK